MGGCSLRIWLQKDAYIVLGALRLRTGFQKIEFLSVSVDRQFASVDRYIASVDRNIVKVTVELSSFGRLKEEKLKPHLRPLCEAATTTWSKHSLGHW
ncbi:hypothetical protein Taro_009464 [Colocasia esculenta]|uniref:Uncharacterized protein n=1 Tax=Colocasia esculenta TaxID=4460 RepID=A0A843U501_COLES|nr:hypothetical protein [Colocasia esculenta]